MFDVDEIDVTSPFTHEKASVHARGSRRSAANLRARSAPQDFTGALFSRVPKAKIFAPKTFGKSQNCIVQLIFEP